MRPQDRQVFAQAARDLTLWILVRRTNVQSLQYIGKPGYTPKPIDCKAKTADLDFKEYRLAGLVADPSLCPQAFTARKLQKAKEIWVDFKREQGLDRPDSSSGYAVVTDPASIHYGAVTLRGDCLHGDYDLYDIIDPSQPHRNLASVETLSDQLHMRGANFLRVQRYLNRRIGTDVVQHGGEAQYTDHSEQSIDVFGPGGEACTILNKFSLEAWYRDRFGGRPTIVLPKKKG